MNQSKTDEVAIPKVFLVLRFNDSPFAPDSGEVQSFGSLEEAREFAKKEQGKFKVIPIYSLSPFRVIERYKKDGSICIRCPECQFDICEADWANHHKQCLSYARLKGAAESAKAL
jgi:hypothetical protein